VRTPFVIVGSLLLVGATASVTPAAPRHASVTIVHGLPGFTADIYLDGRLLLDGFAPTETAGPLRVSPRRHEVDIREIGAASDSSPVLSATLRVRSGSNSTIVAHLTGGGEPALTVFDNAFARLPAGRSLLQVRNLAGGRLVSVLLDGREVKAGLRFRGEWGSSTAPGWHRIAFASSTKEVLIPRADIHLTEGVAQVVYVTGSPGGDDLELMLQRVRGLRSAPSGVLTGIGGLAGEPRFPGWAIAVMVAAGVGLVVSTARLVKERA
jgi:uncharacterized protein DUF4397